MRTKAPTLSLVRCAIYTRKSTEEGLDQDFNSLDAQREAGEAFVKAQQHEGWVCLPERYDDGGFSGGNVDRPGLRKLMEDVEAGKVDVIVVYKIDRLSRSLLDFAKLMQTFEERRVSFVSVTQQFNTASSMGRLILNVLLSFAQFEREIIGERTRDKIAATRRKGKWSGGRPILGYDLDRERRKLVINEEEATLVRGIFQLYLDHQSLLPVVRELENRGWVNKRWINLQGKESGGQPFTKTSLHRLLTNPIFIGQVRYRDEIHEGEQPPIIEQEVWDRAQALLKRNGNNGGCLVRNKHGAILKGLLRCAACGCSMTPSHTKKKEKLYRYYTCVRAQKKGWDQCPVKSIPAHEIESLILQQIRVIGEDPALLQQTLAEAKRQDEERLAELESEKRQLERDCQHWHNEMRATSGKVQAYEKSSDVITQLAELQDRIAQVEQRILKVSEHIPEMRNQRHHESEMALAVRMFDPLWESLTPIEQMQVVHLLIEQVSFDGENGKVSITFHSTAIRSLVEELGHQYQEQIV